MKHTKLFLMASTLILFLGCREKEISSVPEGYELAWSDEFDYEGCLDSTKWTYSTGNMNGWGNGEIQNYTDKDENSFVKDGILTLKAVKNPKSGKWTSARVKTQGKASWKYGYFEIRAKLPKGKGTWPAIWMLPAGEKYGTWPRSGEIDIMEMVGFDMDTVHASAHTKAFNHKNGTQKTTSVKLKNTSRKFHNYGLLWTENEIKWLFDGKEILSFSSDTDSWEQWPFDIPFYLILNIAIGGTWGGEKGIDKNLQNAEMQVDYARVYQKK